MKTSPILVAAAAAFLSAQVAAQLQVFGGPAVRAATTLVWFSDKPEGGMSISYGQGEWKDEYTAELDKKGKRHRFGKDWWTTFDTSKTLDFGNGVTVPAGSYFLGLESDAEGKFKLAVLRSGRAIAAGIMPFTPDAWQIDFSVPLTFEKGVNKDVVKKLTIELAADKADNSKVSLAITWGTHRLSANCKTSNPEPGQGRGGRGGEGRGGRGGGKGGEGKGTEGGKGGEGKGGGEGGKGGGLRDGESGQFTWGVGHSTPHGVQSSFSFGKDQFFSFGRD